MKKSKFCDIQHIALLDKSQNLHYTKIKIGKAIRTVIEHIFVWNSFHSMDKNGVRIS